MAPRPAHHSARLPATIGSRNVLALLVAALALVAPACGGGSSDDGGPEVQGRTVGGTGKADILAGTPGADRILGRAGNDQLDGGDGDDLLVPGTGNDVIACGEGRDTVRADSNDIVGADCEVINTVTLKPPGRDARKSRARTRKP